MSDRILLLAIIAVPLLTAAGQPGLPGRMETDPDTGAWEGDSITADPAGRLTEMLRRRAGSGDHGLPFGLDRLLPFADLISAFEFPGGLRLDVGLDGIGIGIEF
jgi:hypothetical protein